jgi:hypothetical protein
VVVVVVVVTVVVGVVVVVVLVLVVVVVVEANSAILRIPKWRFVFELMMSHDTKSDSLKVVVDVVVGFCLTMSLNSNE